MVLSQTLHVKPSIPTFESDRLPTRFASQTRQVDRSNTARFESEALPFGEGPEGDLRPAGSAASDDDRGVKSTLVAIGGVYGYPSL